MSVISTAQLKPAIWDQEDQCIMGLYFSSAMCAAGFYICVYDAFITLIQNCA
jgi:hypothetical protein